MRLPPKQLLLAFLIFLLAVLATLAIVYQPTRQGMWVVEIFLIGALTVRIGQIIHQLRRQKHKKDAP